MIPTPTEAALTVSQSAEISLLVKTTAMLLIGLTSAALARKARASVRHLLLAATFAALLATPAIFIAVPETTIAIPVAPVAVTVTPPAATEPTGTVPVPPPSVATPVPPPSPVSWRAVVQLLWLTGASLFLAPLALMVWQLRALRRTGLPWPEMADAVRSLARDSGVEHRIDALRHEGVITPITFGVWQPVILMPPSASEWSDADLRRALVHEIEHVRRSDWIVHLAARVASAAYWFHPLAWVAWRQLVLEAERSCDDAVVAHEERTDYAEQLVTLARRLSATPGPALGMAHRSDLAARVTALLDDTRPRGRAGIGAAALTVVSALAMVLAVAPLRAVAVSPETGDGQLATTRTRSLQSEIEDLQAALARRGDRSDAERTYVTVPLSYRTDGRVLIGGDEISIDALAERLRRSGPQEVLLRADGGVMLEELMQVMDRLKQGGVERVAIAQQYGVAQTEKRLVSLIPRRLRALDRELLEAAESGDLEDVKDLIDAGANVDAAVDGDGSPLIVASRANRLAVVVELLNRGADVNLAVSGDGNPLIAAAAAGAGQVVDLLLSRGAMIDLMVDGDENALIQAAGAGHFFIVQMLVNRGAEVNARARAQSRTRDGSIRDVWRTPLNQARRGGHGAVVAFLLQAGARE